MSLLNWLCAGVISAIVAACVIYAKNKTITQKDLVELAVFPLLGWLGFLFVVDILLKKKG